MEIKKWLGLSNVAASEHLKTGALEVAKDVDITDAGGIRTRLGRTLVTATPSHSMFQAAGVCLVAQGADLKRVSEAGTLTQLKRLRSSEPISYVESNGVIYFTNGTDTGRVVGGEVREWGIRPPLGQPAAVATTYGTMPPGRYRYAATYIRADGLESGTRAYGMVELPATGGISFSATPTSSNPEVAGAALYVSGADGVELYRAAVTGFSPFDMFSPADGPVLDAEYVEEAPPGTIVEFYKGVAYVVDGSVAWASDLYSLERFRRAHRFVQLPGQLALFAAVDDGIFAATEKGTWFLQGDAPDSLKATQILTYGAVPGTAVKFDVAEESEDGKVLNSTLGVLWTTQFGIVLGSRGGQTRNLTEGTYGFPTGQRGAALLRVARGQTSYLTTTQGAPVSPNAH